MVRLAASRSSSAESRLCLPHVPVPSDRRKKAACPLQRASETSPKGPLPFPVPEQFAPVAGGTLQTWPTEFRSDTYLNAMKSRSCPVFFVDTIEKIHTSVPKKEHGIRKTFLQSQKEDFARIAQFDWGDCWSSGSTD